MADLLTFAGFAFDRSDRILYRGAERIPLAPKAIEALALLLATPGALVAKEALRDALWPDGFVEDGNLTQTIYLLRRTLDPSGDGRAFIETLPRRGYRFVAALEAAMPVVAPIRIRSRWPAIGRRAAGFAAIVVALGLGAFAQGPGSGPSGLHGEAARLYALGRYYWNQRSEAGFRESIRTFERVVALAPRDPLGYAGLADAYEMAAAYEMEAIAPRKQLFAAGERYARKALALDPRSGEAVATLGYVAFDRDRDLARARKLLETALALRPSHATAHEIYGVIRLFGGDLDAALVHFRRATELDPISSPILAWYGTAQYYDGHLDEARVALRQAVEINPQNNAAMYSLVIVDEQLARFDEARSMLRRLANVPKKKGDAIMLAALLDVRANIKPAAMPNLAPRAGTMHPYAAAALCLALGRRADALRWIDIALRDPDERFGRRLLAFDPLFAELRNDARFRTLTD